MPSNINCVHLSGNLTRDAELRQTQGGSAILRFGIACNDRRKNPQTGEWEDYPNYIDCTMFGNRANALAQYLTRGTKVCLEGKLRWSQWERDGQKRSKLEVIVDEIEIMSQRQGGQRSQMAPTAPQMPQNAPQMPQQYMNPPQQQMAPQAAPQSQYGGYQPTVAPPGQSLPDLYQDDIPFGG